MKKGNIDTIQFRRKKEGKTNYRKRLKMLLSNKPRLVVRKSLNNISAQIIEHNPKGDRIIISAHSTELKKFGWKTSGGNIPSAYLVGFLIGKKAKEKGIEEAILDVGLNSSVKGSRIYALLKGSLDSRLKIPYSSDILPDEKRIKGKHIIDYASLLKKDDEIYKKRFGNYLKNNINPLEFDKYFDDVKKKIIGGNNG